MSSPAPGVTGELTTKAGVVRATIVPGTGRNQIQSVSFSGTFKSEPVGILAKLEQDLSDVGEVEARPRMEGNQMFIIFGPKRHKTPVKSESGHPPAQ